MIMTCIELNDQKSKGVSKKVCFSLISLFPNENYSMVNISLNFFFLEFRLQLIINSITFYSEINLSCMTKCILNFFDVVIRSVVFL